ncbi:DUF6055 domain-containing protein, partial [Candidatus Sumerlaeota bacterium]
SWMIFSALAEEEGLGGQWFPMRIFTEGKMGETPFSCYMRLGEEMGVWKNGVEGFGDAVGRMAAKNATWDYINQEGYRPRFEKNRRGCPLAHVGLEPVPDRDGWLRPFYATSPRQYGFNIIPLIVEKGAKQIAVRLEGMVDESEGSEWRATLVADDAQWNARYSKMIRHGQETSLETRAADTKYFLTVAATPSIYKPMRSGMGTRSLRRYPYEVKLTGASVDPKPFGYPEVDEDVRAAGRRHPNGGGFLAKGATVDPTAYVGPEALVLGNAFVIANARIEGHGVVMDNAMVGGNAVVSGYATVRGSSMVKGQARVRDYAVVGGRTNVNGDAHVIGRAKLNGAGLFTDQAVAKGHASIAPTKITGNAIFTDSASGAKGVTLKRGLYAGNCASASHGGGETVYDQAIDFQNLYAHWDFDETAATMILEDKFEFNDGFLRGKPAFGKDGERGILTLNGADQYVLAGKDLTDWRGMTLNIELKWDGGSANQPIFAAGRDAQNRMYLTPKDETGKAALVIIVNGKKETVRASRALPEKKWSRLQLVSYSDSDLLVKAEDETELQSTTPEVELTSLLEDTDNSDIDDLELEEEIIDDGEEKVVATEPLNVVLYIDGKEVGSGKIKANPFQLGATASYLGRSLDAKRFFKGSFDDLALYTKGHKDIAAIRPPPPADDFDWNLTPAQQTEINDRAASLKLKGDALIEIDPLYRREKRRADALSAESGKTQKVNKETISPKQALAIMSMTNRMRYLAKCVYADKFPDVHLAARAADLQEGGSCYRPPGSNIWHVWHTPEQYEVLTGKRPRKLRDVSGAADTAGFVIQEEGHEVGTEPPTSGAAKGTGL